MERPNFTGWATRNDLQCSDGRIIRKDAFKHNDGMKVPLVWNHDHTDPYRVVGHALLENRDEGVYAYGYLNDTELGRTAKVYIEHGDITQLSIYANQLKQQGPNVMHGSIREVSLVLAGANPGAFIDNVIKHGDEINEEEARIFNGLDSIELYHADDEKEEKEDKEVAGEVNKNEKEETIKDIFDTLTPKQKNAVYALVGQAVEDAQSDDDDVEHSGMDEYEDDDDYDHDYEEDGDEEMSHADETIQDIFDTLTPKQKDAVYMLIGQAIEDNEGGNANMKHNVFDTEEMIEDNVLTHSEMAAIMDEARRGGSLKEAVLSHGIEDIDLLFPDARSLTNEPEFIKRNDDWVAKVLAGVHHSPFSRIKTVFADITAAQARAKGYQTGNMKIEEVFKLLKRVTNPTTVYKKQALDRDDILDMDFNHLPWLKREIRMMLDEEFARAYLVGDGRDPVEEAADKIDEECIRPIWKMEDLFTVKVAVTVEAAATNEDKAKAFIKACIKSRKLYKGSGNPDMFMSEDMLTDCLLIEDVNGRRIYDTVEKLAATLRVREIVPVPIMEGLSRTDKDGKKLDLAAIYVNLKDYNVGTDKGGEVNFFDDFDIDYNKQKYLMEARCSGTLVKPHSAVVLEFTTEVAAG